MYGKFFASTFTGSMFGAGPTVFAVWGYVIAHTIDGRVELNPPLLAAILGTPIEAIDLAIAALCAPDVHSRNPEADGRRLQREGQYQYLVTSHEHYRTMRNEDARRAYNRQKQQESRARRHKTPVKQAVIDNYEMSTLSAHTEAEAEAEADQRESLKTASLSAAKARRPIATDDDAQAERAGNLIRRYEALYAEHRHGARLRGRPALDWTDALDLCRVWDDDGRLDKLAIIVLTTDDDWITRTDRSFKIFAMKAAWADDRLKQWERANDVTT